MVLFDQIVKNDTSCKQSPARLNILESFKYIYLDFGLQG